MEEYEDRACIFFVALDKEMDIAACVKDNNVDEKELANRFLGRMEMEYDELSVKEISMDWELWVEDGKSAPQKITFGKMIKLTGLNRIPLKGM